MRTVLYFLIATALLTAETALAQPGRDVTWTQMDAALHPFGPAGGAVLGNYMYVFGYSFGEAFNVTTEHWEESTAAAVLKFWCGSAATDSAIYLIGGYDNSVIVQNVERFTPVGGGPTGTWTQLENYPLAAQGTAVAWDGGNYIYAAGGYTEGGYTSVAFKYDIANDVWIPIESLAYPMGFAGGAFVLGKFYAVGGMTSPDAIQEYDPGSNTWQEKANALEWIVFATNCTAFNDSLIFTVGGGDELNGYPSSDKVQIYNPLTDAWYLETPLPVPVNVNHAHWIGEGKIISAGGAVGTSWSNWSSLDTTWNGSGFPSGSQSAAISVTLSPVNPPIVIPASGGSFDFNVTLTNNTTSIQMFDTWIMVQLPSGTWYGPVLGPVNLTLAGGASVTRLRSQAVPASAPAGTYTYRGYVGSYGTAIWDSSSFTFEKSTTGNTNPVNGWENSGQSFETETAQLSSTVPAEYRLNGAYPNPFNPTTTIGFALPEDSRVHLAIYDVAGRLVATLVDGWRDAGAHEVSFDASDLASGLYFARLMAGEGSQMRKLVLMK